MCFSACGGGSATVAFTEEDGVLSYAVKDGKVTIIDDNDPTSKTIFEMK